MFRNQAGVLEKEINKAEKSVEENREEMTNLKWQLQQLDSTDPTYVIKSFFIFLYLYYYILYFLYMLFFYLFH